MKKTSKTFRTFVLITAAVALGAFGIAAIIAASTGFDPVRLFAGRDPVRVDEEQSLPAAGAARLEVRTFSPDILFTVSRDSSVHAHLTGSAAGQGREEEPRLIMEKTADGAITIRVGREPELVIGFYPENLSLEVAVPAGFKAPVSAETSSGEVGLNGLQCAALRLKTSSGDVSAGDVTADDVSVTTTSGEVRVKALASASAAVRTSSGSVSLGSVTGRLAVVTSSGEVAARFAKPPAAVDVQSHSGDVTLGFPVESGFVLDARAGSGDVSCDFPITVAEPGRRGTHELYGTVGGGGAPVKVRTSSGGIRIVK